MKDNETSDSNPHHGSFVCFHFTLTSAAPIISACFPGPSNTAIRPGLDGARAHSGGPAEGVYLVGGLENWLFFHLLGTVFSTHFPIFQRGWNHQPVIIFCNYQLLKLLIGNWNYNGQFLMVHISYILIYIYIHILYNDVQCGCNSNKPSSKSPSWCKPSQMVDCDCFTRITVYTTSKYRTWWLVIFMILHSDSYGEIKGYHLYSKWCGKADNNPSQKYSNITI